MKKAVRERRTRFILIENIIVDEGPRPINEEAVHSLANSMAAFGMHAPIQVESAARPDGRGPNNIDEFFYRVIAGRHRIAAARSLGWERIEALDFFDNPYFDDIAISSDRDGEDLDYSIASRMWAIAENLKRSELTALERDSQIAEWIDLEKKWHASLEGVLSQVATKPGRPESGVRAAARELGLDKDEAYRAVKVASLSDEAKATAVEVGLDNNRTALLYASRKATPAEQVEALQTREWEDVEADQRKRLMNAWNAASPTVKAWFREVMDEPVMDRRFA